MGEYILFRYIPYFGKRMQIRRDICYRFMFF
jgi:hypothetical protein